MSTTLRADMSAVTLIAASAFDLLTDEEWALVAPLIRPAERAGRARLPKRWIVERTLGWISRNRRLCGDYERHTRIAAAFVRLAMIRIMLGRNIATHPTQVDIFRMGSKSVCTSSRAISLARCK